MIEGGTPLEALHVALGPGPKWCPTKVRLLKGSLALIPARAARDDELYKAECKELASHSTIGRGVQSTPNTELGSRARGPYLYLR